MRPKGFVSRPRPVAQTATGQAAPSRLIVTRPSLQHLAETHDQHAAAKFAAKREAKIAKEHGDLSENAEYRASKEKFRHAGKMQQRVGRELKQLEDHGYTVVDPADWLRAAEAPERVDIGVVARVTQNGFTEDYLVVGAKDIHLPTDGAVLGVPYTSPLGQALVAQTAPATVKTNLAGESRTLHLVSLRRPTAAEIKHLYPELSQELPPA
jgi:transcription elongation GreA/GreB family factor